MKLTCKELKRFNDEVHLFRPSCFAAADFAAPRRAAEEFQAIAAEEAWRKSS